MATVVKSKAGNILISAIFIAVFLFFLSVALISTNRQDINLTVLADHKLRARHAAEEAATYALQTMKEDQQWETLLLNKTFTNSSVSDNVSWSVMVKPMAPTNATAAVDTSDASGINGSDPNPTRWDPAIDKIPHFYEVVGKGVSGVYSAEYRLMVEEFRLSDGIVSNGLKPYLFMTASSDNVTSLCMLDPTFTWHRLAALSADFNVSTLTGNGGDVYITSKSKKSGPQISDWNPVVGQPGGFYVPGAWTPTASQFPEANDLLKLELTGNEAKWTAMPDPNKTLAKFTQATVNGAENGTITTETVFVPGVGAVLVDTSDYKGPVLQYYVLDGDLHAEKDGVYCHATHYFYSGWHFKNRPVAGINQNPIYKKGKLFKDACILRCKGGNWAVTTDVLKITDPYEDVIAYGGPQPSKTYLTVTETGKVYALGNSSKGSVALEATATTFTNVADLANPFFFFYDEKLRGVSLVGQGTNSTLAYTGLPLTALYPNNIPEQLGKSYRSADQTYVNVILANEKRLNWRVSGDLNGVAQFKQDIIATGTVNVSEVDLKASIPPPPVTYAYICHYDGSRWQLWPGGYPSVQAGQMPMSANGSIPVSQNKFSANLSSTPIALGGYASSVKILRHYQPIMTAYP